MRFSIEEIELLAPKWFDKNPALSNEENSAQLRASLALVDRALSSASAAPASPTCRNRRRLSINAPRETA
jgi:hypothetical protein